MNIITDNTNKLVNEINLKINGGIPSDLYEDVWKLCMYYVMDCRDNLVYPNLNTSSYVSEVSQYKENIMKGNNEKLISVVGQIMFPVCKERWPDWKRTN